MSSERGRSGQTILVVDNLIEIRALLSTWLTKRGYRVVEAESGEEAIEVAGRERPDLIFMDIRMPGMDGISAGRSIREHAELRDVMIVAVSADNTEYYKSTANEAGFNGYITKPIEIEELKSVLDRLLPAAEAKGGGR